MHTVAYTAVMTTNVHFLPPPSSDEITAEVRAALDSLSSTLARISTKEARANRALHTDNLDAFKDAADDLLDLHVMFAQRYRELLVAHIKRPRTPTPDDVD